MSTETVRLIRDGKKGGRVMEVGERESIFCADLYFGICSTPMMEGGGEWGSGKRAKLHLPVHTAAEL